MSDYEHPGSYPIFLNAYQIANLYEGLQTLRALACDTGDWMGEILNMLPQVDVRANLPIEQQLERARNSFIFGR